MQRIMGLASFIVIAIAFLIPNSSGNGRSHKDYYTDAHFALHKLVRETTHSHLEDFEIVVLDKSLGMSRQKRDLKSKDSSQPITFSLSSRDHDFHVELEPNADLLADDFSVHRVHHQDGIFKNERIVIPDLNCHHIGRILSHENRKAAISTCGGLTGLLRTENDDFMIEPVPSHLPHEFPDSQQPHLLYKKHHMSRNREDVHICGKARRNPITTSLDDISEIKELSNGEIVIVQGHHTSGHQIRKESARRRPKRSEPRRSQRGNTKVIETLVVVDKALIDKHDWLIPNVTHYVLTASSLYKDPTLDEEIDIILTDLILLEDDKGLHLDHRADKSLTNFCMWQSKANITGRKKPDHAILITGTDICIDKNEPCDTLGLAQIGGMCSTTESCTINEDTGIGVAFTIAHETGHSFGLRHDGQGNSCGKRDGHVMSPTLNTKNGVFTWSACSRRAISNFFKSERSQCLDEQPSVTNIAFPDELPGQRYNASTQCKLQYGAQGDICYERYYFDWAPICKELFCFLEFDGVCKTKHMPAAEGTSCGYNKWCRRGVCVPLHSSGPDPVNGGWSRFGSWSECSRTCGRGISFKERSCSRPTPQYGGRFCEGEERIYRICNSQNCPADSPSYRAQQCSVYNSKPYRRQYFTWIPFRKYWKYNDYNKCELFCEAEGFNFFDRLDSRVIDGTPCDEDTNDVCIEGHCVHVGCDHRINSNATVDACGVCNGDNSTCNFVNGTFRNRVFDSGYYYLVRIPKGARTIRIWEERCCTHTYIATRSAVNGSRYYLNGNWRVDLYGGKRFAGATWVYERKSGQGEALYTAGPLKEDIVVEVLIVRRNPGVSFTYALQDIDNTLPHDAGDPFIPPHTYAWTETFSTCSRTCGEGIRNVTAKCVQNGKHVVGGLFCNHSERPPNRTVNCNIKKCPERWKHGNWSACSRSCGDGVQTRKVVCVIEDGNGTRVVPPKECHDDRPLKHRRCLVRECPAEWKATRWTKPTCYVCIINVQCSKTCGRGIRARVVYCKSGVRKLPDHRCGGTTKPRSRGSCLLRYCRSRYQWSLGRWGKCSVTCGKGKQYRNIKCTSRDSRTRRLRPVHHRSCRSSAKPKVVLHKSCSMHACVSSTTRQPRTTRPTTVVAVVKSLQKPINPTVQSRRITTRHEISSWVAAAWQACTASCGGGQQVRTVRCMLRGKPSVGCSYARKPANIRSCNTASCTGDNVADRAANREKLEFRGYQDLSRNYSTVITFSLAGYPQMQPIPKFDSAGPKFTYNARVMSHDDIIDVSFENYLQVEEKRFNIYKIE